MPVAGRDEAGALRRLRPQGPGVVAAAAQPQPTQRASHAPPHPAGCLAGGIRSPGVLVPQGTQYFPRGTRPNPYLANAYLWYTEGISSYNALQTEVTHRLSPDLQFRVNYTWAKNLDMNSGLTGAQSQNQSQMVMDRNDLRRDWGPSALNITSQSSISVLESARSTA